MQERRRPDEEHTRRIVTLSQYLVRQFWQRGLDPAGRSENSLDARPATPRPDDDQVAGARLAEPLAVDHDRHAGHEERLADDELAAPLDLDDNRVFVAHVRHVPSRVAVPGTVTEV